MKRFRSTLTYANVMATVAVFIALGGTSVATVSLSKNTVSSQHIKNGQIKSADLGTGAVVSSKLQDGSVTGVDVRNGSLGAAELSADATSALLGPIGPVGPAGPKGDPGAAAPRMRWALVNAAGQIEAQSGGFTVQSGYVGNLAGAAGNVYIDAGEDLSDNGILATMALQNAIDQDGDGVMNGRAPGADANPEFAGEISVTRCAVPGVVTCAPAGTNVPTSFVVSPRNSDGTVTNDGARKRFYVTVSG